MLSSISPVGEASRGQRWWVTATAYTVAATGGGLLLGVVGGGLGALLGVSGSAPWTLAVLTVALLAGAAVDRSPRLSPPSWHRQVDERWLTTYRGWVYGAGFGAQLGVGVATIVPTGATYVMLLATLLSGDLLAGAAIGACFGLVRALPLLAMTMVRSPTALRAVHANLDARAPTATRVTVLAQATLAALAALSFVLIVGG